jgi:hypothetical protein
LTPARAKQGPDAQTGLARPAVVSFLERQGHATAEYLVSVGPPPAIML